MVKIKIIHRIESAIIKPVRTFNKLAAHFHCPHAFCKNDRWSHFSSLLPVTIACKWSMVLKTKYEDQAKIPPWPLFHPNWACYANHAHKTYINSIQSARGIFVQTIDAINGHAPTTSSSCRRLSNVARALSKSQPGLFSTLTKWNITFTRCHQCLDSRCSNGSHRRWARTTIFFFFSTINYCVWAKTLNNNTNCKLRRKKTA